jgi:DNA-binding NarL/FixJ family response regulator
MSIRLLTADDHEVVRVGLTSLLSDSSLSIVGQASSGNEAVQMSEQLDPDVILMDVRMGSGDGLWALEQIKARSPEMPVVVLSSFDNPAFVSRAMALGASGYVLKGCSREHLIDVLCKAAAGENSWTSEDLRRFAGGSATATAPDIDVEVTLTKRESEVLEQLASGLTNKEIAKSLHIGYETVKEHVQNILRKIGVSDRTQAAVWAVRKNLV